MRLTGRPVIQGLLSLLMIGCLTCHAEEAPVHYSLDDCLRIALTEHQSIRIATSQMREAEAKARQARSLQGPQVDFDTSWTEYQSLPQSKQNIIGGGTTDVYSEVALRQLLYSGGRTQGLLDQARLDLLAAHEKLRRTRQSVVFQVSRSFFLLRQAEELLKSQQEAVNQVQAHLDIAQKRLSVGTAREVDVLRAEVQLADVQQAKIAAENAVAVARMTLNTAMGRPAETPLEITTDAQIGSTPATMETSPAEELPSHPEWIQSELAIKRADAGLTVAKSLARPDLALQAAYNLEGGSMPPDVENWNLGLQVSIPLWDSGNAAGAKGAATARIEQTKSAQALLRQKLELAIGEAEVAGRDAQERQRVTALSAEEARRALMVEQERYRVGAGSSIEVIDAQGALTRAETNAIRATNDYRIALAQLDYALGRDPAPIGEQESPQDTGGQQ